MLCKFGLKWYLWFQIKLVLLARLILNFPSTQFNYHYIQGVSLIWGSLYTSFIVLYMHVILWREAIIYIEKYLSYAWAFESRYCNFVNSVTNFNEIGWFVTLLCHMQNIFLLLQHFSSNFRWSASAMWYNLAGKGCCQFNSST